MYVSDIGKGISLDMKFFVDDCTEDAEQPVEAVDWLETWQIHFNFKKCSVMHITRKRVVHHFQYTINGDSLGIAHHYS